MFQPQNISLIFIITAAVAFYVLVVLILNRRAKRLRAMRALYNPGETVDSKEKMSTYAAFCSELLGALGINLADQQKKYYNELGRAGIQTDAAIAKFFFFRYIIQNIVLVMGIAMFFAILTSDGTALMPKLLKLLLAAVLVYVGIYGHQKLLRSREERRKVDLVCEFPDAVDLMLVCVESGMGLDVALSRVSKELRITHPVIASELDRTKLELGISGDRVQAIQNLGDRTNVQCVRSLVSALVQTEKYGTNLASTLRVLAADYRSERLMNAETKAARVGAILTLPIVIGVFFPVMALIMAPPIIRVMATGALSK
jgi:tight adherence protein C